MNNDLKQATHVELVKIHMETPEQKNLVINWFKGGQMEIKGSVSLKARSSYNHDT